MDKRMTQVTCRTIHDARRMLWLFGIVTVTVAIFFVCGVVSAAETAGKGSLLSKEGDEEEEPMVEKTIPGVVCGKSKKGLAVVYGADAKTNAELSTWLPFSEGVEFSGYQTMDEITLGDSVSVTYEETQEGGFKRSAKKIHLVKKPSNEENPYYEFYEDEEATP